MNVELIDIMGDDIRVVNAARVSFDKKSDWETVVDYSSTKLSESDEKLINYLAKHNHWTPFSHVMITMKEKVPIFVARQRFKHMVGFTYNEISRRYVDDSPEFFTPNDWRGKPVQNKKQGSSDVIIPDNDLELDKTYEGDFGRLEGNWWKYKDILELCNEWYSMAISMGVAPEQARMILPQSMYTEYYVTGSLSAWARAYKLRSDTHSQKEIQELAEMWSIEFNKLPQIEKSWKALTNEV